MKKNLIVLFLLLAVLAVMFAGCGSPANGVGGLWYEETGFGGTLEFKAEGVVTATIMGTPMDGAYTFDAATGKGTITMLNAESPFELKDGKLDIDGTIYTRDKVE